MGERKGQLKWYPPDFDPRKHKSLDAYHGTHPLRERAKKLDKGILIIRFEMPYDIWCGGCGIHIAQSVRYNAEKSKIGMYYTTPIWKFRMRCHLCPQYFEIKTDPANHDYIITEGARRKEKRWDPKENEQIVPDDKNDIKKMKLDPMYNLEHGTDDKAKLKAKLPDLADIEQVQSKWRDDYMLNQQARSVFRVEKKKLKGEADADANLLKKSSLDIALVKEHEEDVKMASLMKYSTVKTFDEKQEEKRQEIQSRSLFSPSTLFTVSPSSSTSSSSGSSTSAVSNAKEERIQNALVTKKKLGLKLNKRQPDAFGTSTDKKKSLGSLGLGIVKKNTRHTRPDESQRTSSLSETLQTSEAIAKSDFVLSCDEERTVESTVPNTYLVTGETTFREPGCGDEVCTNESKVLVLGDSKIENKSTSAGLGSLIANYDSSGSESGDPD